MSEMALNSNSNETDHDCIRNFRACVKYGPPAVSEWVSSMASLGAVFLNENDNMTYSVRSKDGRQRPFSMERIQANPDDRKEFLAWAESP
jgi:hypothetical protein